MKNIFILLLSFISLVACKKSKDTVEPGEVVLLPKVETIQTYGGMGDDQLEAAVILNNEIYSFGTTKSFADSKGDFYLLKTDLEGNVIYEKNWGGAERNLGFDISLSADAKLLMVGSTFNLTTNKQSLTFYKLDQNGEVLIEKNIDHLNNLQPISIIETKGLNYCIAATESDNFGTLSNIVLCWLDQDGNLLKKRTYGGIQTDGSSEVIELADGSLMLHGYTHNASFGNRDLYLLKLNSTGDSLWSKNYGGSDYEESQGFFVTAEGDYVMNGHSASRNIEHNMLSVKTDPTGNVIWERNFGGNQHDGGQAAYLANDGSYILIGRSMSFSNNTDIYFVQTDQQGIVLKERALGGSGIDWCQEVVESDNYFFLIGRSNSYNQSADLDGLIYRIVK
jgi:hypothetical protein